VALKDEIPALSGDLLDLVARRLRVIAEPTRMRIVSLLEQHEATVQELTDRLSIGTAPLTHQNVSKHLAVLYREGICSRQRDGSRVRYALADYTACQMIEQALASTAAHFEELAEIAKPAGSAGP
jgi:DNA-binding transcriptional ArsR family regulator